MEIPENTRIYSILRALLILAATDPGRARKWHYNTSGCHRNIYIVIMFAHCASSFARSSSRRLPAKIAGKVTGRSIATKLGDAQTASCAWKKSCYNSIDYTIGDECTVFEGEDDVALVHIRFRKTSILYLAHLVTNNAFR
jgi:hypothetical protein